MFPELPMRKLERGICEGTYTRLIALEFPDKERFREALRMALAQEVPFDVPGYHNLIMPVEYESVFQSVPYKTWPVKFGKDLTLKERKELSLLRRRRFLL